MDTLNYITMYRLHEIALCVLAAVYVVRIIWLHLRFRSFRDRQPQTGNPRSSPMKGAIYSLGVLGIPWHMESIRKKPSLYAQFVLFHLGVAAAIALSIILPYAPEWHRLPGIYWPIGIFIAMGFIASMLRLHRRVTNPRIRVLNTFDDYFSLGLLTIWLFLAFLSTGILEMSETIQDVFFGFTVLLVFYVPFSKISHYLYYPFSRYLFGRSMGWRGVYPVVRVPVADAPKVRRAR